MTWSRREVLATLGVASAQAMLAACGGSAKPVHRATQAMPEVRTWLHDAVRTLRGAGFDGVHVLAVQRSRITAGLDVLGGGVARASSDGVVLSVRDKDGVRREHVTNALSRNGIADAVRVLAGKVRAATVDFGPAPAAPAAMKADPAQLTDDMLLARVAATAAIDPESSSRIVYSAALLDIDDAHVWSVAPGRDLEQRNVRVRKSITRVAWNGTRPVISEAARAWSGGVDEGELTLAEAAKAREDALALMTPRAFVDGEYDVLLEPTVAAQLIDRAVRALMTADAARRPEVANRLSASANAVSTAVTLVDDPGADKAYGGFEFDDTGQPASAVTLIDHGRLVGRIGDGRGRRAGHVGMLAAEPSHLRVDVAKDARSQEQILAAGFVLEGAVGAVVDPASDRLVLQVARARERAGATDTGRMFGDIEVVGSLASVLTGISELSKETSSIGVRDEVDGLPRWRSIETPWIKTRAVLRARRGPA